MRSFHELEAWSLKSWFNMAASWGFVLFATLQQNRKQPLRDVEFVD
jgi:hypothetical protein